MSKRKEYEEKIESLAAPYLSELGLILYDTEYVKEGSDYYLRIYIDRKPDGVDIDDCEKLSTIMNPILDKEDFIEDAYIFEVSSPGLGRTLTKDRHLEYSIGEEVELKLYTPRDKKKEYEGVLKSYDKDSITIEAEGKSERFERKDIASIRLKLTI